VNDPQTIVAIAPRLHPIVDGVGDYALRLAHQLRQDFQITTHFIVGDPKWNGATEIEGFPVHQVPARSSKNLLAVLNTIHPSPTTILLHYVGHGYMKRGGSPIWLIQALKTWKANTPNSRLVTMFHEIYAPGEPIWNSDFWFCWLQKRLAIQLSQMSDRCLTSCQKYAATLHQFSEGKHSQIPVLPIISNVGEHTSPLALAERKKHLVVFGRPASRARAYQQSKSILTQVCQQLSIEEICDIGPAMELELSSLDGVPITKMGQQPTSEISEILSNSIAGFINYDLNRLPKSGIFAAYCAYGLLPVTHQYNLSSTEGVEAGIHYWSPIQPSDGTRIDNLQAIATNAYGWYQTHNSFVQAKVFAQCLFE